MFTHVEEGACMLQDQLTGVRLVLAVIHVDVELISLEKKEEPSFRTASESEAGGGAEPHPGDEAVTDVLRQLLVVHQLLQENTADTQEMLIQ